MTENTLEEWMRKAITLSLEGSSQGKGGPFGAVIIKNNQIIGQGYNQVTSTHDPTAHAEIVAIRDACRNMQHFHLEGCILFTSCEPCPMCLGAIYWAKISHIYYANNREDAAKIGFSDDFIYKEFDKSIEQRNIPTEQFLREEALEVFKRWENDRNKIPY